MSVHHNNDTYDRTVIKIEDSPEPDLCILDGPPEMQAPLDGLPAPFTTPSIIVDPKDPEAFLRRCSGHNSKTKVRCRAIIGRNSQHAKNAHPQYLPTCYAHRDQQSNAGWCQFMQPDGERCGRLFRWTPPYFELCQEHQGHPDTPCYFMKLPLELRQEIFRYLLPTSAIGSSISPLHQDTVHPPLLPAVRVNPNFVSITPWPAATGAGVHLPPPPPAPPMRRRFGSRPISFQTPTTRDKIFPFPLINLLLLSKQICIEAKDLLYSTIPFTIDIRKDGTFMCGRRLLEPRRADGSSHLGFDDAEKAAKRFISVFDWAAVKNYNVDILVENWNHPGNLTGPMNHSTWDEEVEIYDIRDYVRVAVNGILAKAKNLCRLNVRLGISKFEWDEQRLLDNARLLVGPFERLRNVRQPRFRGVFEGTTRTPFMINMAQPEPHGGAARKIAPLCSVPELPVHSMLLGPGDPQFDAYKDKFIRLISQEASGMPKKAPIEAMFTSFKDFYSRLAYIVPDVMQRHGRMAFLHRARVARENEDIESFRHLRNELIQYWNLYLDQEEQKKTDMNTKLSMMLDMDVYPSHEIEQSPRHLSPSSDDDCVILDVDKMIAQGMPMQGNQITHSQRQQYQAMQMRQIRMQRQQAARQARQAARAANPPANPNSSPYTPQIAALRQLHQQQMLAQQAQAQAAAAQAQAQAQVRAQAQAQAQARQQHSMPTAIPQTSSYMSAQPLNTSFQLSPSQVPSRSDSAIGMFNSSVEPTTATSDGHHDWDPLIFTVSPDDGSSAQAFEPNADPGVGSSDSAWADTSTWMNNSIFEQGESTIDPVITVNNVSAAEQRFSLDYFLNEPAGESSSSASENVQWSDLPTTAGAFESTEEAPVAKKRRVDSGPSGYVEEDGFLIVDDDYAPASSAQLPPATDSMEGIVWDGKGKGKARADARVICL